MTDAYWCLNIKNAFKILKKIEANVIECLLVQDPVLSSQQSYEVGILIKHFADELTNGAQRG